MPDLIITLTRLALTIAMFVMVGSVGAQTRIDLIAGWNLMGNSSAVPIDVAATLGDASKINSVWTWNKTASKWAFYAPSMTATDLATYAEGKGYDVLTIIPSKEGFWVNASTPSSLPLATSSIAKLAESDLQVGWNLVSSADFRTPSQLNQILSSSLNGAGKVIASTWAWDKKNGKWKFYAPSLEAQGGSTLDDYVGSKGYLPFTSASTFSATDGYWVNIGTVTPSTTKRKAGLYYNYAKIGYYSDQQSSNQDDVFMHNMIDRFKEDGYTGVLFEITIGVSTIGNLQHDLKYDRMLTLIDYAKSIGLGTGIMPNWNFDGGNADYMGNLLYDFKSRPIEFSTNNFFSAIQQYFIENASVFEAHKLDLLFLANNATDFYTQEHYESWRSIVAVVRNNFNGTITCNERSVDKDHTYAAMDSETIWGLLDAISISENTYVSGTPIYIIEDIVSGYYHSQLNYLSFMSEVIGVARRFNLPIMLQSTIMNLDNALDGGWDPTKQQAMQAPLPTNPTLQATAFKAFFHAVSNNLYPYVTSITVGNYEPWTYTVFGPQPPQNIDAGDWALWKTFGYFDMSHFPAEAENVVRQYMSNPSDFRATDVTKAGPANDIIYVKNGSNKIYLNGGYDEVYGGIGNDQIVISPKISGSTISISFSEWIGSSGTDSVTVRFNGAAVGTINITSDSALVSANPGGYWSRLQTLTIPIFDSTALPSISVTCSCIHGFVQVANLNYGKAIDPKSATHTMPVMFTGDTKQPQPQWVYSGDIMTFNLTAQTPQPSTFGSFTYIDGGDGSDTIEFDPPQNQIYFKISKSSDLTVVTDPKGIYPEVRMKNVEWIKFADGTVAVQ